MHNFYINYYIALNSVTSILYLLMYISINVYSAFPTFLTFRKMLRIPIMHPADMLYVN